MQIKEFIKKYWGNALIITAVALLLFVPESKVWVLRRLMDLGLFRVNAQRDKPVEGKDSTTVELFFTGTDNKTVSTTALKGKVVFINYWATWCPPCLAEMPSINELYNKLKQDSNFVFITADADGNLQNSMQFMQKNNYSLPLYKPTGNIPENVFSGTLPTTIILDANGHIANRTEGIENYNTPEMIDYMKSLLNPEGQ